MNGKLKTLADTFVNHAEEAEYGTEYILAENALIVSRVITETSTMVLRNIIHQADHPLTKSFRGPWSSRSPTSKVLSEAQEQAICEYGKCQLGPKWLKGLQITSLNLDG